MYSIDNETDRYSVILTMLLGAMVWSAPPAATAATVGCGTVALHGDGFEGFVAHDEPVSYIPDTGQTTSFTENCGEDADYRTHPPFYSVGPGFVTDQVTGKMWQEPHAGFHTWYEAAGVADATHNPGAGTNLCGDLDLGGHDDWRLPTRRELIRIVDFGRAFYALNDVFTPESKFWAAESRDSVNAWYVSFTGSNSSYVSYWGRKFSTYSVRCVRGPQLNLDPIDRGDGTVSDLTTRLTWQQTDQVDGQTPPVRNWEQALAHCESLEYAGKDNWRVPNITELESIRGLTPITVASPGSHYWSSTTTTHDAEITPQVWTLNFLQGYIFFRGKSELSYALCVSPENAPQ